MNRMSSFTKKFGQLQQWTAEKAGKAQKSEVDAEFKQLEQFADTKREVFEQLTADGKLLIQTRGGKKNAYATVGATMVSAGSMLSEDSAYGEALVKCGEAFVKVGSAQVELEGVISERFLGTAQARLDGDMKEFTHQRKKLENRRLDYDAKNSKLAKKKDDKGELEQEVSQARAKYEESVEGCREIMETIVHAKEEDDIEALAALVEAQRAYAEATLAILTNLSKTLNDRSVKGTRVATGAAAAAAAGAVASSSSSTAPASPVDDAPPTAIITPTTTEAPAAATPTPAAKPKVAAKPEVAAKPAVAAPKPAAAAAAAPAAAPVAAAEPQVERVKGAYNFTPENEDELAFRKGDIVVVLAKGEEGWWTGEIDGRRGIFPSNYVVPL